MQEISAGFTLEAPDVIVLLQGHQGLTIFEFVPTAGTSSFPVRLVRGHFGTGGCTSCCGGGGSGGCCGYFRSIVRDQLGVDIGTSLTQAIFSRESDPFSRWKGLAAGGALKAALVVGLAQSGDHLALDEGVAFGALGAEVGLVAASTIVFFFLAEKTTL